MDYSCGLDLFVDLGVQPTHSVFCESGIDLFVNLEIDSGTVAAHTTAVEMTDVACGSEGTGISSVVQTDTEMHEEDVAVASSGDTHAEYAAEKEEVLSEQLSVEDAGSLCQEDFVVEMCHEEELELESGDVEACLDLCVDLGSNISISSSGNLREVESFGIAEISAACQLLELSGASDCCYETKVHPLDTCKVTEVQPVDTTCQIDLEGFDGVCGLVDILNYAALPELSTLPVGKRTIDCWHKCCSDYRTDSRDMDMSLDLGDDEATLRNIMSVRSCDSKESKPPRKQMFKSMRDLLKQCQSIKVIDDGLATY